MTTNDIPRQDPRAETVEIDQSGMVRVDGPPQFRRIVRGGRVWVQFADRDRMRSACRGTRLVEIPLDALAARLCADLHHEKS